MINIKNRNQTKRAWVPASFLAVGVLLILYSVGFYGLRFSPFRSLFQSLVPINLLLTNAVLFAFHPKFTSRFWLFAILVAAGGFLAEVLGVHTALLFGEYWYGAPLGPQVWEVPLLIGLNWLMLVYSAGHVVDLLSFSWPLKALLAAFLMVGLDFIIEPVAVFYDFWTWQNDQIPLSNFVGWFILSLLMQILYQKGGFQKGNKVAPFIFMLQVIFFTALLISL
jgi:uncharacterized membrane protein